MSLLIVCGLGTQGLRGGAQEPDRKKATELQVSARAVEQPLMKYRLLPAEYELRDGNAAPILLRLPWEQAPYFSTIVPTYSQYLDLPLDDPKVAESGTVFPSRFYRELRRAAFRRDAVWEYPFGEEPAARILLPDVQGARAVVGRRLSVWIRYQISQGELDKAREGILVGFAVSRHYARTPFTIVQLVGSALDSFMLARVEEFIAHPNSPNLYWALTALPRPFLDLRPSVSLSSRSW